MPQIGAAFGGWTNRIIMARIKETVVDGFVQLEEKPIYFYGTIQPLSPREIELKPEGQRSFTWLQIHCASRALNLIPGQKIKWNGKVYKVMARLDYDLNGFLEFHVVQDYKEGAI